MAFRAGDQGRRRGRTERPNLTRTRLMRVDTTGGKPEPSLRRAFILQSVGNSGRTVNGARKLPRLFSEVAGGLEFGN